MTENSKNASPNGFALIATISILVLLALISVGLLSLSTVTIRTSSQSSAKSVAQANARLGLMIALGELQKSLGPDQAISARSEILATTPSYPMLTGAFKSARDNAPDNPTDYFETLRQRSKEDTVWLVSSKNPVTDPSTETPAGLNGSDVVKMQLAYNRDGNEFFVQAGKIPLSNTTSASANGSYAWWVDDESQKAKINISDPETLANGQAFEDRWKMSPSQQANFFRVDSDPAHNNYTPTVISNYDPLDKGSINKLISLSQADIPYAVGSSEDWFKRNETDFTTWSQGLPVDVLEGRLKQDLSFYLETGLGLEDDDPLIRGSSADSTYSGPDLTGLDYEAKDMPRFGLIKSWKEIGETVTGFDEGGTESKVRSETEHGIHPVLLRAGIYYAPYLVPEVRTENVKVNGEAEPKPAHYVSWKLAAYPRVTIWNPTSVPITDEWFLYQVGVTNHFMLAFSSGDQTELGIRKGGAARDPNNVVYTRTFNDGNQPRLMSFYNMMNANRNSNSIGSGGSGNATMPLHTYALRLDEPLLPGQTRTFYPESGSPPLLQTFKDTGRSSSFPGITKSNASSGNVMSAKPAPNNYFRVADNGGEFEHKIYATGSQIDTPATTKPSQPEFLESYLFVRQAESGASFKGSRTNGCAYRLFKPNDSGPPTLLQEIFSAEHTNSTNGFPSYSLSNAREYDDPDDGAPAVGFSLVKFYEDPNQELSSRRGHQLYISYALEDPESDFSSKFKDESRQFSAFTHYNPRSTYIFPGTYEEDRTGVGDGETGFEQNIHGIRQEYYSEGRPEASWLIDWPADSIGGSEDGYGSNDDYGSPGLYDLNINTNGLVYPLFDFPREEDGVLSLGELQAVNFATYPWQPGNAFGNSFADPRVKRDQVFNEVSQAQDHPYIQSLSLGTNRYIDLSWLLNYSLWDRFFLSTIDYDDSSSDTSAGAVLRNSRNKLTALESQNPDDPLVDSGATALDNAAANIRIDGAFNVNTTSVAAWKQFLSSNFNLQVPVKNSDGGNVSTPTDQAAFPRLLYPYRAELPEGARDPGASGAAARSAFAANRSLSDDELHLLAEKIVEEVRLRGPFLSVSDFVNRRLVTDTDNSYGEWAGLSGVLQTALDRVTTEDKRINEHLEADSDLMFDKDDVPDYLEQSHVVGRPGNLKQSRLAGAPGSLSQADILRTVGPMLTARGDTFRIRAYGESLDPATGQANAKAWCEAVVQRLATTVDPDDDLVAPDHNAFPFGRKFKIVSFRWLNENEL